MPETTIRVRLTPRSGVDRLVRLEGGVLHARVAAPPVDGAANRALLALLAEALGLPRSALSLRSGATGRDKTLVAAGLKADEVRDRLERALGPRGAA